MPPKRQRPFYRLHSIIIPSMLILGLFTLGAANPGTSPAAIDPKVLEDTRADENAYFIVVLKEQADLSAPRAVSTWQEQGELAYAALLQTATTSQAAILDLLKQRQINYRSYWIVNAIALKGTRQLVDQLAAMPEVARVVSDHPFPADLPSDSFTLGGPVPSRGIEDNISQVNAPNLWSMGYTGQGIIYANADTGVEWDHPALINQYAGWDGITADHNFVWWDAIHDDNINPGVNPCGINLNAPCDDHGHGTHTTGIGVGDDGVGHQIGVAPGAKWIACRNMDSGIGQPSTYIECLQFFTAPTDLTGNNADPNQRAHVISNSYSCTYAEGCTAPDLLHDAVENVRAFGIFMAASAGNSGSFCETVNTPPPLEEHVFTIGAVDDFDQIASFSSRGPVTWDGSNRLKPELVAPGVGILSSTLYGSFVEKSGTSMSAPHVAGGVALLWSAFPEFGRKIEFTEIILAQSAAPLYCTGSTGSAPCCSTDTPTDIPNNVFGYGRLNLLAAYQLFANSKIYYFPLLHR